MRIDSWTTEEDAYLRKSYGKIPNEIIYEKLCDRSIQAIQTRASTLNVSIFNITGQVFGRLTALERTNKKKKNCGYLWICKCSCGNFCERSTGDLRGGHNRSCGCLRTDHARNMNRIAFGLSAKNSIYTSYIRGSQRRGITFELEKEEFLDMIIQPCFYCGSSLGNKRTCNSRPSEDFMYTGIDRLNNTLGYIKGNVVPCCEICNKSKMKLSVDEFLHHIKKIYEHSIKTGLLKPHKLSATRKKINTSIIALNHAQAILPLKISVS